MNQARYSTVIFLRGLCKFAFAKQLRTKNDFKLLKCLKCLKMAFIFCSQNTRFLALNVSRGLGSTFYPKLAIVSSFCVPHLVLGKCGAFLAQKKVAL